MHVLRIVADHIGLCVPEPVRMSDAEYLRILERLEHIDAKYRELKADVGLAGMRDPFTDRRTGRDRRGANRDDANRRQGGLA